MAIGRGAGFVGVKPGSGAGKTQFVVTVGVGGGAISQAQIDGIVNGLASGASLQNSTAQPEQFTVIGVETAFTPASSTDCQLLVEGGEAPSTTTGEYFASATLSNTATFEAQQ